MAKKKETEDEEDYGAVINKAVTEGNRAPGTLTSREEKTKAEKPKKAPMKNPATKNLDEYKDNDQIDRITHAQRIDTANELTPGTAHPDSMPALDKVNEGIKANKGAGRAGTDLSKALKAYKERITQNIDDPDSAGAIMRSAAPSIADAFKNEKLLNSPEYLAKHARLMSRLGPTLKKRDSLNADGLLAPQSDEDKALARKAQNQVTQALNILKEAHLKKADTGSFTPNVELKKAAHIRVGKDGKQVKDEVPTKPTEQEKVSAASTTNPTPAGGEPGKEFDLAATRAALKQGGWPVAGSTERTPVSLNDIRRATTVLVGQHYDDDYRKAYKAKKLSGWGRNEFMRDFLAAEDAFGAVKDEPGSYDKALKQFNKNRTPLSRHDDAGTVLTPEGEDASLTTESTDNTESVVNKLQGKVGRRLEAEATNINAKAAKEKAAPTAEESKARFDADMKRSRKAEDDRRRTGEDRKLEQEVDASIAKGDQDDRRFYVDSLKERVEGDETKARVEALFANKAVSTGGLKKMLEKMLGDKKEDDGASEDAETIQSTLMSHKS